MIKKEAHLFQMRQDGSEDIDGEPPLSSSVVHDDHRSLPGLPSDVAATARHCKSAMRIP